MAELDTLYDKQIASVCGHVRGHQSIFVNSPLMFCPSDQNYIQPNYTQLPDLKIPNKCAVKTPAWDS